MPNLIFFEWSKAIDGYSVETFWPEDVEELDEEELEALEIYEYHDGII